MPADWRAVAAGNSKWERSLEHTAAEAGLMESASNVSINQRASSFIIHINCSMATQICCRIIEVGLL